MNDKRSEPVLAQLLPTGAAVFEAKISQAQGNLYPAEAALVAQAVDKRRTEFTAGRTCLRQALQQLEVEPSPILRGPQRNPLIPHGYSASISHSNELSAAAAIATGDISAIGIDIEEHSELGATIEDLILLPQEQQRIKAIPHSTVYWSKVLFSAKESFYKAYFQIVGEYLDFLELDCTLHPQTQSIEARLQASSSSLAHIQGKLEPQQLFIARYAIVDNHIYTAFTI